VDLIEQYRQMHRERAYGATSVKKAPYILPYVQLLKARTVIDYGCGQSSLAELISERCGAKVTRYDPGLPAYDERPNGRFDLLINIDVLEHVPEDAVDGVIAEMATLSDKAIIIIDTRLAATTLSDGRNAHLTLRPPRWWKGRLARHYPDARRIWVQRRPASFVTWRVSSPQTLAALTLASTYKVRALGSMLAKDGMRRTLRKI
jgi:hypothetical protein